MSLWIDLETFSEADLPKTGVYRYAEDPSFEILLFGISVDGGPVTVYDLAQGDEIPSKILMALMDPSVIKSAYNAQFERVCMSRYLWDKGMLPKGTYLSPRGWHCDMVWAGYMGFPMSLKGAGEALGLESQKMEEGKSLITYFCKPYRPTSKNGYTNRNLPSHDPEKWNLFKQYNIRDVEVEMAIAQKLSAHPVPDFIWEEYIQDQLINDRGILVDLPMVKNAIFLDRVSSDHLKTEMRRITVLANPGSVIQLQGWLKSNGVDLPSLGKKELQGQIDGIAEPMRSVLVLRQQAAMSAVKKYQAMATAACEDGRCRGMFKFYGGNRTGRFSGAIVQLQNLFKNTLKDLDVARDLVKRGDYDALSSLYDSVPEVLAQCVRTAFIPEPGKKFIVADFSAIEARVIAWLANEEWRMEAFSAGKDIYCASASQMFGVPVEKHGVNGHLRAKGKVAELACLSSGSLVLTDRGEVPIEDVKITDKVWDGEEWVAHEGVVYRGEREVITYDGLTATPDHLVWVEGRSAPVQFGDAAAEGRKLVQTGNGRRAIRLSEDYLRRIDLSEEALEKICSHKMSELRNIGMERTFQSQEENQHKMSSLPTWDNTQMARQKADSSETTMCESKGPRIQELWSEGDKVRLSECDGSRTLFDSGVWSAGQNYGVRQNRRQWELCSGQSEVCIQEGELRESSDNSPQSVRAGVLAVCGDCGQEEAGPGTEQGRNNRRSGEISHGEEKEVASYQRTARLYDIRNAGRHHRFTVSGKLVHNCGYGGSVGALKAMGALDMGLKEEELPGLIKDWRAANPNIVKLWWSVDKAVKTAVKEKTTTSTHGLTFRYQGGMLYITLPSGRNLAYVKPRIGENRFGGESVTYMGTDFTRHWSRIETFGGKCVENIVQGIARDILCYAMSSLRDYRIVAHVHDECIVECQPETTVEEVCNLMALVPPWAPGLILRADGYECSFYQKD